MTEQSETVSPARAIVDAGRYLTLATADADGVPWATPVWYAHREHREFVWVSQPDARHSRNLAVRPQVAIVIFDSTVAPAEAEAAYFEAVAEELTGRERDAALAVFSSASEAQRLPAWTLADVEPPAAHRLYRAVAERCFVLGASDQRVEVEPG